MDQTELVNQWLVMMLAKKGDMCVISALVAQETCPNETLVPRRANRHEEEKILKKLQNNDESPRQKATEFPEGVGDVD